MKIIISQDGQQVFTVGENNLINISPLEIESPKMTLYSVGIEGISFGVFKRKENAEIAFKAILVFLCEETKSFKMPDDKDN